MKKEFNRSLFDKMPIIGILRGKSLDETIEVLPGYVSSGLGTIEITLNSPDALRTIRHAVNEYGTDLNVGAGTVCDIADLERAVDAGATFIVTPIVEEQVIQRCKHLGIPVFPGAMTPTEIFRSWALGATLVKVFPASVLTADYLHAVKGPLNQVRILATGGIGLDELERYWLAGADGFGIGSPLFPQQLIERKDWQALTLHFGSYVTKMRALIRGEEGQS